MQGTEQKFETGGAKLRAALERIDRMLAEDRREAFAHRTSVVEKQSTMVSWDDLEKQTEKLLRALKN